MNKILKFYIYLKVVKIIEIFIKFVFQLFQYVEISSNIKNVLGSNYCEKKSA